MVILKLNIHYWLVKVTIIINSSLTESMKEVVKLEREQPLGGLLGRHGGLPAASHGLGQEPLSRLHDVTAQQ